MSNTEWLADARRKVDNAASEIRAAGTPVMDLRQLTDEVRKLHTRIRDLLEHVDSVQQNLATHEQVLGQIGAYDAASNQREEHR